MKFEGYVAVRRLLAAIVIFALFGARSVAATARDSAAVVQELQTLQQQFGGYLGVEARNLATGEIIRFRATERFPTASAIKFPTMAAYFRQVALNAVNPYQPVQLDSTDKKPGSGVLQFLGNGLHLRLADAVTLMIILSDNTATNLVIDHLPGPTLADRLKVVNGFLDSCGLPSTRLLNKVYSGSTKQNTGDAIRFGLGVSTPEDMAVLMERLYRRTLVDSASSEAMLGILNNQQDMDMLPRLLPAWSCKTLTIPHKTGSVSETKVDVGLVLSDRVNFAIAIFVDKHPDHREGEENRGTLLAAHAARAIWNHFTGDTGYSPGDVFQDVDWTFVPGGNWAIYRSSEAPFPHPDRKLGHTTSDSEFFPAYPHYTDSSIVVFVPNGFHETAEGTNLIVHFHGHNYDNLRVLHHSMMVQTVGDKKINALLVIPQGPFYARDSFGGKMEDEGGFRRLVENVLAMMHHEGIVKTEKIGRIIVSGHSGGYRPAAYVLARGGLSDRVTDVFLFDAFYGEQDKFKEWLTSHRGTIHACYTDYLVQEHLDFQKMIFPLVGNRFQCTKTTVEHGDVVQAFFPAWLAELGPEWKLKQ